MILIKKLSDLYINGSVHVALSCYALTWISFIELGIDYNENLLYFIFYATISGYNFVKFFGVAKFHHRSLTQALKWIQTLSFVSTIAMFYYFFGLKNSIKFLIFAMFILTLVYALPLFPNQNKRKENLRNIHGVKVYIIAIVWAVVSYVLPLLYLNQDISFNNYLGTINRFLFILLFMLPFELRDLKNDNPNLGTIPQLIGVNCTKQLSIWLSAIITALNIIYFTDHKHLIVAIIFAVITMVATLLYNEKKSRLYTAFFVESIPIFWLLTLLSI